MPRRARQGSRARTTRRNRFETSSWFQHGAHASVTTRPARSSIDSLFEGHGSMQEQGGTTPRLGVKLGRARPSCNLVDRLAAPGVTLSAPLQLNALGRYCALYLSLKASWHDLHDAFTPVMSFAAAAAAPWVAIWVQVVHVASGFDAATWERLRPRASMSPAARG